MKPSIFKIKIFIYLDLTSFEIDLNRCDKTHLSIISENFIDQWNKWYSRIKVAFCLKMLKNYKFKISFNQNKKPMRLENSQLLRKTWNVILEQCVPQRKKIFAEEIFQMMPFEPVWLMENEFCYVWRKLKLLISIIFFVYILSDLWSTGGIFWQSNIRTFQSQKLIPQNSTHSLESQKNSSAKFTRKPQPQKFILKKILF